METSKEFRIRVIKELFRKNAALLILSGLLLAVMGAMFFLYRLPMEPYWYTLALAGIFLIVYLTIDFVKLYRRAGMRLRQLQDLLAGGITLEPEGLAEQDYTEMVKLLLSEVQEMAGQAAAERRDCMDYYTTWVHQIKTPISVMRLRLGNADTPENRALSAELFRIEQYVEMVLQYLRLGSESTDLVIKEYPLDEIIRENVRKFAPQFVYRKLGFQYEATDYRVVTDKKWLSCILEQLLSNAVKYTPSGAIGIDVTADGKLKLWDEGIGIAPEDLPRIFEKGYTGSNGRMGEKSSGLGLYLCKKAADLIGVPITVESTPGKGTCFCLDLRQEKGIVKD